MADCILETDKMIVMQAQLGDWDNLNHLLVCKKTRIACIIDPFFEKYWIDVCENNSWSLEKVWLTHSHWDHSKGINGLTDREIWVHQKEALRGWDGPSNREWTNDNQTFTEAIIGELRFEAHCTPGHTPGHMTFIGEGVVISGDCMFLGRCGRTDLFGGDVNEQRKSLTYLRSIMQGLPDDWLVLPGHQYQMPDGSNPTYITLLELLENNQALLALDDDDAWESLDFLAFDDSLAEKARREKARSQ